MISHQRYSLAPRAFRLRAAMATVTAALLLAPGLAAAQAYPNYGFPPTNPAYPEVSGFEGFQLTPPYTTDNPFNGADMQAIQSGFDLFNEETFEGNGRTCSSCHIPSANYNISVSDFNNLSAEDQDLVLGGANLDLENEEAVTEKMLFNINQGAGTGTEGDIPAPLGPFRASMTIGGLGLAVLNDHVCKAGQATPAAPGTFAAICNNTPGVNPNNGAANRAIDDGLRDLMLGWSGEGPLEHPFPFIDDFGDPQTADCDGIIEEFAEDESSLRDLDLALATFALAAVKTHFPLTQDREPGDDFRCPTREELLEMAQFQKWLGRRFELDITQLKFSTARAQNGRNLFSTRVATCVGCHVNAGASDNQGRVKASPAPFLTKTGANDFDVVPEFQDLFIIGTNKSSRNGSQFLEDNIQAGFSTFTLPFDKGDGQLRAGTPQGGFNVQAIVDSVRNKQFFHHNGVTDSIEDAIEFYFTDDFKNSQGGTAVSNAFRRKNPAVAGVLYTPAEARAFLGGDQGVADMGLFLRSLAAVYALADCERFIDEMADRAVLGLPMNLPADHCRFALADVKRLFKEVPVPSTYTLILLSVGAAQSHFTNAQKSTSLSDKLSKLKTARGLIASSRRSIAKTPELY